MASFIEKLRLDNLYPSVPIGGGKEENLYDRFTSQVLPRARRDRLADIEAMNPRVQQIQTPPDSMKPMDVIYNPSISNQLGQIANVRRAYGDEATTLPGSEYQRGTLALREKELAQKGVKQESDIELGKQKVDISKQRADTYQFKANNPNAKYIINKVTGTMQAVDPISQKVLQDFGKTQLGEEELINLNQEKKLEQIGATGAESRATEGVRQTGRESLEDIKSRHAKELQELGAQIGSKSKDLPTQQRTATLSKAEEARNTHPEWKNYIKIVPGGGFAITAPGYLMGPSEETYKKMNEFIYGGAPPKKEQVVTAPKSKYQVTVK